MKEISSKDNKVFRHALNLKKKKYRDQYGEYLIEGPNLINEALKEGAVIEAVFVRPDFDEMRPDGEVLERDELRAKVFLLAGDLFKALSDTETPQGLIAVVRKPEYPRPELKEGDNVIILDRLQDPGNIGTVLRTADAAGFALAVFIKGTADPFSPKVVRSAAGSLLRVPVYFAENAEEAAELMRSMGKKLVTTAMDAELSVYDCDISRDCAIVIGNEGNGVDPELIRRADLRIKIPMQGGTESLNASVAAGILMYERIRRQNERSITANP
ncbi:MAG: RNA methyltransferase [Firmicutes bacterium]|nr:RNA methyltransferase [Bacillota bacterium]